jgi:hypothetical protein
MKRYREEELFYELTSVPDAAGRFVRYYAVTCRKCKARASYHAACITNDALRKIFQRRKWDIGRTVKQNLCPACSGNAPGQIAEPERHQHYPPEPATPAPAMPAAATEYSNPIGAAWNMASNADRVDFIHGLQYIWERRTWNAEFAEAMEVLARTILAELGNLSPAPTIEPTPPDDSDSQLADEFDQPADWWQNLMSDGVKSAD